MSEIKVNSIKGVGASAAAITVNNSDGTCTLASGSKLNNCTTDGTTNFTIADGNLVLGTSGHGIDFSAAGNAGTMTAELLDDYEEGTWDVNDLSGSRINVADSGKVGKYVKIGAVVHAWADFGTDTTGATSVGDKINIGYLPFNANGISNPVASVAINYSTGQYSTTAVQHVTSSNEITFVVSQTTGHNRNGAGYYVQISYFTDS
mgnify:CR=1 FL=1